jgi:hypothetical protein
MFLVSLSLRSLVLTCLHLMLCVAIRANEWRRTLDVPQESTGAPSPLKSILQKTCKVTLAETISHSGMQEHMMVWGFTDLRLTFVLP